MPMQKVDIEDTGLLTWTWVSRHKCGFDQMWVFFKHKIILYWSPQGRAKIDYKGIIWTNLVNDT